ncbi:hypothetical protein A33Q_3745 [Indibacter alkaliphilus LW1]|uniref:Uncharacterized protein n=1 Tax=Indibacter alkaliphilus (strain CCUG 57479 / KCTC 22604 / LW1) TaxID=1189612 RepID=S2DNG5_INDAL|nr:hypothetical protein [Indibacter alkaliphilus]EOZ93486.1 hypothetical protein A33Q_3745 [Indibacter alkaliphilus LW1]
MIRYLRILFFLPLIYLCCVSCATEEPIDDQLSACETSDAISQLTWLKEQFELIRNTPESGIILYQFNSREVIEIQSPLMSSTNQSQYYCDGTKLDFDAPEIFQDFLANRVEVKILHGVNLWGR